MERYFTDAYIKSLKPKSARYEEFKDGGFGIRVTPKGLKTWLYRYRIDGQRYFISLGHYPTVSLSEAKKKFIELSDMRKAGINPQDHLQEIKLHEPNTVKNIVLNWYSNYIEKHRSQPLQIKQQLDADIIPLLGDKEIETLKTRDITHALDKIVRRGSPVHANKILSTLKQAFNYAVSRGEMSVNPAANIRSRDIGGLEKPRDRYLNLDEIRIVWSFLEGNQSAMSLQIKIALKILLLIGVRFGELRIAKWSEFDFNNSLWTIPAQNTKTGIIMHVHLTGLVKLMLKELYHCSEGEYVVSGADGVSALSEKALPKAVLRIQDRVNIPHWTAHDLRRTFATQLGETLNIDPVVIEKCLGHKMPKIMATYNKNEMLPQRKEALERWENFIKELVCSKADRYYIKNIFQEAINEY